MKIMAFLCVLLLSSGFGYSMQSDETSELYKLCQIWFPDQQIRTIASNIVQIQQRKGSFVSKAVTIEVRSNTALAQFDAVEQVVAIHSLELSPSAKPVATLQFNEMLKIRDLIESKNKK